MPLVRGGRHPADACPRCGQALKERWEEELTGDEWCRLGLYWTEEEPADDEKALACFRRSASLGSGWGTCNLGLCMEQGIGIQPDLRQAVWLYKQAVEMGSVAALCNLGVCLEQGIGTPQDPAGAASLYLAAAEHGSARGQRMLAHCLEDGIGVDQDHAKAVEWLRTAALQGEAPAQTALAKHYEFGVGTEQDKELTVRWYEKAVQGGDPGGHVLPWVAQADRQMGGLRPGRCGGALPPGGPDGRHPGHGTAG